MPEQSWSTLILEPVHVLNIDLWQVVLISGFQKQDPTLSYGKQKAAEIPCELRRWDAGKIVYGRPKNI